MEALAVLTSFFLIGILILIAVVLSKIPIIGDVLDFFAEVASGLRFIYLAWPFLLSKSYRHHILIEHQKRIKWLAWIEYLMATLVFILSCTFLFLVTHHNVTRLLLDRSSF